MKNKKKKYIFVVGGVMSGVGKGIAASSIGKILQCAGYRTSATARACSCTRGCRSPHRSRTC